MALRSYWLQNLGVMVCLLFMVETTADELFHHQSFGDTTNSEAKSWFSSFKFQHLFEETIDLNSQRSLKEKKKPKWTEKGKKEKKASKNIGFYSQGKSMSSSRVDPTTPTGRSSPKASIPTFDPQASASSSSLSVVKTSSLRVDEDAAANEVSRDWDFANSRMNDNMNEGSSPILNNNKVNIEDKQNDYLMKYKKKSTSEMRLKRKGDGEDSEDEEGKGRVQRNSRVSKQKSQSYADIQKAYAKRKDRENRVPAMHANEFMTQAKPLVRENADKPTTIEEKDMEEMKRVVEPYLVAARVRGVIPRRDVVPQLRQDKMPTRIIKLFKRLLISEGIDLDGGEVPGKKFLTRMQPCENDEEEYINKTNQEDVSSNGGDLAKEEKGVEEDAEEQLEKKEALLYGQVVTTPSGKKMCLKKRRQPISPSNFASVSRTVNGSMPTESICKCVRPDQPVLTPLRWLHIPKCGTSLGMSLIYYACHNVPDSMYKSTFIDLSLSKAMIVDSEIRVHHAGIDPRVPANIESDFNYKTDCLKRGAFVSRSGVVGSHAPLDYTTTWDTGLSRGKVVCFFRNPQQRIISAYWHAQHADGMSKSAWSEMRGTISEIERPLLHWREKIAKITHAQMTRDIPDEIIDDYRRAMAIYFNTEGVQGCMTKMIIGYRCAEQDVTLTPQLIQKAEDRLRSDFAFIGLTEEWDVSICLFHQMLGGNAREVEFVNYRAGRASRSGSTAYDVRVLDGLVDTVDNDIYSTAKAEFLKNLKTYASCPENAGARFSPEHLVRT